jgi:hypothetical protein
MLLVAKHFCQGLKENIRYILLNQIVLLNARHEKHPTLVPGSEHRCKKKNQNSSTDFESIENIFWLSVFWSIIILPTDVKSSYKSYPSKKLQV